MKEAEDKHWTTDFQILTTVDLDFVIGLSMGWPIGLLRESPSGLKRNILAASTAYQLGLASIDYAQKRYVTPDAYEHEVITLGSIASDVLKDGSKCLRDGLANIHTEDHDVTFGRFGAGVTLIKVTDLIDTATMLSNKGLLLETLPLLRLSFEMVAWAATAFYIDEDNVRVLRAQACIAKVKTFYESAGTIYGYLSRYGHWEQVIHGEFLSFDDARPSLIRASRRHRAASLILSLVVFDVLIEVLRALYPVRSDALIADIQGCIDRDTMRRTHQIVDKIVCVSNCEEFRQLQSFLR